MNGLTGAFVEWWRNNGQIPSHVLARKYKVFNSDLQRLIVNRISYISGVDIPNCTPKVEVWYSKEALDRLYHPVVGRGEDITLEMIYLIRNGINDDFVEFG